MESLLILPENKEQLKAVKAFLKALKVPFQPQESTLPDHIQRSVEKGLLQFEEGQMISLEDFKRKHFIPKS